MTVKIHDKAIIDELQLVVADLMEEASGELYSEEEKVAILACVDRVKKRIDERIGFTTRGEQYTAALAKSMQETKEAVMASVLNRNIFTTGGTE